MLLSQNNGKLQMKLHSEESMNSLQDIVVSEEGGERATVIPQTG
jgi:hypothetical protein